MCLAAPQGDQGSQELTEAETLAKFDRLVGAGVVKYDYSYTTKHHQIGGLDVCHADPTFWFCPS